jgi:hypothetical protein
MERKVGIIRTPSAPLRNPGSSRVTIDLEHRAADTGRIHASLWTSVIEQTLTESQKIQRKKIRPANQRQPDVIFHE